MRKLTFCRTAAALAAVAASVALPGCGSSKSTTGNANGYVNQGLAADKKGDVATALADFQKAATANPLDATAYYDIGVLYQERGDDATAVTYYQKALVANPKENSAAWNLALIDTSSDPTESIALYQQILTTDANDPSVLLNLGLLLEKTDQSATGAADVEKALRLEPSLAKDVPASSSASPTGTAQSGGTPATTTTTTAIGG